MAQRPGGVLASYTRNSGACGNNNIRRAATHFRTYRSGARALMILGQLLLARLMREMVTRQSGRGLR